LNEALLNTENQDFINNNLNSDTTTLLLKKNNNLVVDIKELIEQIEAKKRCQKKLPTWFHTPNLYYPNKLNIEQTSSETTAAYKAKIISGESIVDLTGGFGIDSYYFSKQFKTVIHCEINPELSKIVKHNLQQLETGNIQPIVGDGIQYLENNHSKFDWIFADPSRRHESKGKVFFLNDCLPNIPRHLDLLFKRSSNILIKTSPLLDLSVGISELNHVKAIHIIAVKNEVKELLWVLEKNNIENNIHIETVNIKSDNIEYFSFKFNEENSAEARYNLPLTYLYEPNSSILKSGGFNTVSEKLKVYKLHKNSHLYTSDTLIEFPGRIFKVDDIIFYNKKEIKEKGIVKANITTRNFPDSVENIRKKFKIKDGGNIYIFATTNMENQKILIICSKLS
jgi:hypothetical protein